MTEELLRLTAFWRRCTMLLAVLLVISVAGNWNDPEGIPGERTLAALAAIQLGTMIAAAARDDRKLRRKMGAR